MIDADELDECFFEYLENKLDPKVVEGLQSEFDTQSTDNIS